MKKNRFMKIATAVLVIMLFCMVSSLTVSATTSAAPTDVADVVENVASDALIQVKKIVNNVVFPVIDVILGVAMFVNAGLLYFNYKKGRELNFAPLIMLFAGLLITLTAPLYVWTIVGV